MEHCPVDAKGNVKFAQQLIKFIEVGITKMTLSLILYFNFHDFQIGKELVLSFNQP